MDESRNECGKCFRKGHYYVNCPHLTAEERAETLDVTVEDTDARAREIAAGLKRQAGPRGLLLDLTTKDVFVFGQQWRTARVLIRLGLAELSPGFKRVLVITDLGRAVARVLAEGTVGK